MAKQPGKVYLGFEDELISENNQRLLIYSVNKLGGRPDWPPLKNIQFASKCPLCGLHRVLIVQCYAPLQSSAYHRSLYVFACVNPNCWIQSESWTCIRSQVINNDCSSETIVAIPKSDTNLTWCNGANDWDDNDNDDTANGNAFNLDDTSNQRLSDEDDESNSFDVENVEQALENLQMFDAHNANLSPMQGAIGAILPPAAAAELEGGEEPGLVTVDTPTVPSHDLHMLLHETSALPTDIRNRLLVSPLQFIPKYIYVEEETRRLSASSPEDHVTDLLNKYRMDNGQEMAACAAEAGAGNADDEQYEEATPAHGDRLFHAFLTRLRRHPGQILRYSREAPPLLGAPLPSTASTPDSVADTNACSRCGSQLICELQLLPSFADTLKLPCNTQLSHLHFLSVLIFTCSQSCWQSEDTLVTETVVFQPEI